MFDTESTESKVISMLEAFSRAEFATSVLGVPNNMVQKCRHP